MRFKIFAMALLMFCWFGDFGMAFWHKTDPTTGREMRRDNGTSPAPNPSSNLKGLETAGFMTAAQLETAGKTLASEPAEESRAGTAKEADSNQHAVMPFPSFASGSSLLGMGLQSSGALLLILAIILLGAYLLKKMLPGRFGPLAHKRHLKVVETLSLGDKRSLHLLQVGEQMILLGSTSSQIAVLEQIESLPAHTAWSALDGAPSKRRRPVSEDPPTRLSSFAKLFSRTVRSPNPLAIRHPESDVFENVLGKAIHGRTVPPSREAGDHASRLAALRESLQSHQRV